MKVSGFVDASIPGSGQEPRVSSTWSTEFEKPPDADAAAIEVARFLFDEVEGGGLLWNDDGRFPPMSPAEAKAYCEAHGHPWKAVSPALRSSRALAVALREEHPVVVVGYGGVRVNETVVRGLREARWVPLCPVVRSGFNARENFQARTITKKCESWWCPTCGPKRISDLLELVQDRVVGHSVVYTAAARFEPSKLAARVRQRARSANAEHFSYRYVDFTSNTERVVYVATADLGLGARTEPNDWKARTPYDAIAWLREDIMIFPGHVRHAWSEGWAWSNEADRERGDSESSWLWFPGLDGDEADTVRRVLCLQVTKVFGICLDDPYAQVPREIVEQIKQMLPAIVAVVREAKRAKKS